MDTERLQSGGDDGAGDRDDIESLVTDASAGSLPAVEVLLERYLPGLTAYVRLRAGPTVRAREEVSDIVQSTCRDILENLDRFQWGGEVGFRRWLYATAMRRILKKHDFHTAQKRDVGRERSPDLLAGGAASDGAMPDLGAYVASFSTPSGAAIAHEEAARIEAAFDRLSDEQRELIVQSRLMGLSHKQIAEGLGKNEGTVRVSLHRALIRLAAVLDGGQ